jgi:hypothetical protein
MVTGFMIILLGAVINRVIEIKRNGGVTTFQNELVGFSTHLVFSMAIWFTIMFIIAIIA